MIVLGTNSIKDTGFDVANSVRFEQSDDPYFQKSPTGDGNQRTFTFSVWLKMDLHDSGDTHKIFDTGTGTNYFTFYVTEEPYLVVKGRISGSTVFELIPSQAFRDPTAWFHLYIAVDTTQGTASNRGKIYINGKQVTDFSTATYPSQNTDFEIQDASNPFRIGADKNLGDEHYDGYMAEFVFVDGAAQAISDFGEFDEDSPTIWKPKDVSGINVNPSHANGNGFYLNFQNSSNLGVDSSGNTNFSVNNLDATDQATDTCTNNFATLNPLWRSNFDNDGTFSQGNCKRSFTSDNSDRGYGFSTMGVTSGKWYWEIKIPTSARASTGVGDANAIAGFSGVFYDESTSKGMQVGTSGSINENATSTAYANSLSDNDIVMFALDMDNYRCWYGINGTWQDSGDPTSGSTGTGDMTTQISDQSHINTGEFIFPFCFDASTTGQASFECNFGGCPAFSISSGNSDGNGYGNFEYSVPANFLALCSKNLGSDGG
jgi:hypothetical protein